MRKKNLNLIITCVNKLQIALLLSISIPFVNAASVYTMKSNDEPLQFINKQADTDHPFMLLNSDTPRFTEPHLQELQDAGSTSNMARLPLSAPETFDPFTKPETSNTYNIKSFSQMLISEYGNNILVQESLYSLYEAKQLWNEVDTAAIDFSYDILLTLKLDQFFEDDLSKQLKSRAYQHNEVNNDIYDKLQIVQNSHVNDVYDQNDRSIDDFIAQILRIETLYYLFAFLILLSVLKKLVNFVIRLFP